MRDGRVMARGARRGTRTGCVSAARTRPPRIRRAARTQGRAVLADRPSGRATARGPRQAPWPAAVTEQRMAMPGLARQVRARVHRYRRLAISSSGSRTASSSAAADLAPGPLQSQPGRPQAVCGRCSPTCPAPTASRGWWSPAPTSGGCAPTPDCSTGPWPTRRCVSAAVAALGGGVAAGGRHRVYVPADESDAYLRRYRLADDVEGNIDVAVIPPGVDPELRPPPGEFVPLAVAWADLLDDPDSRARNAARGWVSRLPRSLSIADGRRR